MEVILCKKKKNGSNSMQENGSNLMWKNGSNLMQRNLEIGFNDMFIIVQAFVEVQLYTQNLF